MELEGQKRKRRGDHDGDVDGKRTSVRKDHKGGKTEEPEDDEVEEFFAILRRIRVAMEYFDKGNNGEGSRRGLMAAAESSSKRRRITPSFERRDFEGDDDGAKGGSGCEEEGETGLDLNALPESEPDLDGEHTVS